MGNHGQSYAQLLFNFRFLFYRCRKRGGGDYFFSRSGVFAVRSTATEIDE